MGRSPKLKSDEFSLWTRLFVEISRCEDLFTPKKVLHLKPPLLNPASLLLHFRFTSASFSFLRAYGPRVYLKTMQAGTVNWLSTNFSRNSLRSAGIPGVSPQGSRGVPGDPRGGSWTRFASVEGRFESSAAVWDSS